MQSQTDLLKTGNTMMGLTQSDHKFRKSLKNIGNSVSTHRTTGYTKFGFPSTLMQGKSATKEKDDPTMEN